MATLKWRGDTQFLRDAAKRADGKGVQKNAVDPWRKWVVEKRVIRMYKDGGVVRTPVGRERQKWTKNTAMVRKMKGHGRPLLSRKLFQFGAMVRSYVVKAVQRGRTGRWNAEMTNRARSRKGANYPAFLQLGTEHIPSRPHILFTDDDAIQLGLRMSHWILDEKKHGYQRRVRRS